jgi:hypothetical protein
MTQCFVLGNGRSRLNIEPKILKNYGKIYGCNALYRDFLPDYLIAVDPKMVIELNQQAIQTKTTVWTNPNARYKDFQGFNFFNPSKGWSSGPTALWLASNHGYETIYILGFDYEGINNHKNFNNVYADTNNYKKSSEPPTFYGNWTRQTETTIKEFPHIRYVRVVDADNSFTPAWKGLKNFQQINYTEFKNGINYKN